MRIRIETVNYFDKKFEEWFEKFCASNSINAEQFKAPLRSAYMAGALLVDSVGIEDAEEEKAGEEKI